jgi:hypothetical protein
MANSSGSRSGSITPVIFVGLGSTGAKIVTELKKRLDAKADPWAKNFFSYLAVTSETSREAGVASDLQVVSLSDPDLTTHAAMSIFSDNAEDKSLGEAFGKWWYRESDGQPWKPPYARLATGAGGNRAVGRLLLDYSLLSAEQSSLANTLGQIVEKVDSILNSHPDAEKVAEVSRGTYLCYVFGLLAGGTCSGTLIDLAHIIKTVVARDVILNGVFLLGDICYVGASIQEQDPYARRAQQYNSLYALAEARLLQCRASRAVITPEWLKRVGRLEIREDVLDMYPYHRFTVIGAKNEADFALPNFNDYSNFVAQYYAYRFSAGVPRVVDQKITTDEEADNLHPQHANNFARIGLLHLTVPREKIFAMLRQRVADELGTDAFKNASAERADAAQKAILKELRWSEFEAQFQPDELNFTEDDMGGLPDTAAEFEEFWNNQFRLVVDRYKPWCDPDSQDAKDKVAGFRVRSLAAIDDTLMELLGAKSGAGFSLGTIQYAIKTLRDELKVRSDRLASDIEVLRNAMHGKNPASAEGVFRATLQDTAGTFPEKSFNPLSMFRRKNWTGAQDVARSVNDYALKFRTLAGMCIADKALAELRERIERLDVVRTLVGREAALPVLLEQRHALEERFNEQQSRRGIQQEVLGDRDAVQKTFVEPLLDEPSASDGGRSRKAAAVELILNKWTISGARNIFHVWKTIEDFLQTRPHCRTAETALQEDRIVEVVAELQQSLRKSFDAEINGVFAEPVEKLTLWDALRRYVRSRGVKSGDEAREILIKMFSTYASRAKHFTKLNPRAPGVRAKSRPRVDYICNRDAAKECFRSLGISSPETFIGVLLTETLGLSPNFMDVKDASPSEMVVLFEAVGEYPHYYEGFEELESLIATPEAQNSADRRRWSDRRFPEWINKWNAQRKATGA